MGRCDIRLPTFHQNLYDFMTQLAKWVWLSILIIFFVGKNIVWFLLADIVVFLLVLIFKPKWLDKM